jgi:uncharacterized protein (UPF0333 family)
MLKKFLKEEKAQGAIEYILLAGGIIVAAVVIFVIYKNIAQTAGNKTKNTIEETATVVGNVVNNELANLS